MLNVGVLFLVLSQFLFRNIKKHNAQKYQQTLCNAVEAIKLPAFKVQSSMFNLIE